MKKLTFGSLFAGIGGFDLGLERAGMVCKWQVEIDPFCLKVLAKHWPDVRRYRDVREVGKHNLEAVDVLAGGFPCQPHSTAGKRRGAKDDRDLWPEYRRVIEEMRPRWVIAENVLGIRTTILDQVLFDLDGLAYTVGTVIVPACAFNAPHRRERIFILAYTNGARSRGKNRNTIYQGWKACKNRGKGIQEATERQGGFAICDTESTGTNERCEDVANASQLFSDGSDDNREQLETRAVSESGNGNSTTRPINNWWSVEPAVGRVANGVPNRVDRLRALGNAVVPQVAEWIGSRIIQYETDEANN